MSGYDVIVAGGGHNGLVCAAGRSPGPAAASVVARAPRPASAASPRRLSTAGRLRPVVVDELELARHGLELVRPDRPDGRAA